MVRNPSSSSVAISPVVYQPSRMHLGRQVLTTKIAVHHIRSFDEQHAGRAGRQRSEAVRIDDADGDSRERSPDGSAPGRRLKKSCGSEIRAIHGDDRGAFRDAIPLDRPDAEPVFEGLAEAEGKFLRSRQDDPQGC